MMSLATDAQEIMWSGPLDEADDKYAKRKGKIASTRALAKYEEALSFFKEGVSHKQVQVMIQDSFVVYICFLMLGSWLYHQLGGSFSKASFDDVMGYASSIAEAFGLLLVRRKIQRQGSVAGVSGMTMVMYAVVYFLREILLLPPLTLEALDMWAVEVVYLTSLLMVLDILRSIFVTYRSSYQEEWDLLRVKYLIPACIVFAAVLHPSFREGAWYSFCWTACLYLDVLALMPQVVMMSRSGGKVSAPISHFVAATAVSRLVDLWFWIHNFDMVGEYGPNDFHFSGWLIIFFHVVHLLLVADFMYYYLKARLVNANFSEDLTLPTEEV